MLNQAVWIAFQRFFGYNLHYVLLLLVRIFRVFISPDLSSEIQYGFEPYTVRVTYFITFFTFVGSSPDN